MCFLRQLFLSCTMGTWALFSHREHRVHALKLRTPPGPLPIHGVALKQYLLRVTMHLITYLKDLAKSDFSNTKQVL